MNEQTTGELNKHLRDKRNAAYGYIDIFGWKLFGTVKNHKLPFKGTNGLLDASNDEEVVRQMFLDQPKMDVAVRTGLEPDGSGFFVVDIDTKNKINGEDSLTEAFSDYSFDRNKFLYATTPSGGLHLLFQYPDNKPIKTTSHILKSVDIRADGGYIVVQPSSNLIKQKDGSEKWIRYKWNDIELPISPCLPWTEKLIALSNEKNTTTIGKEGSNLDLNTIFTTGVPEGERDQQMFLLACMCSRSGIDIEVAKNVVRYASDLCIPPFEDVERKVQAAYSYHQTKTQKYSRNALNKLARGN